MKIIKTLIIFVALCASQLSHAQSDMKVDTISQPAIGAQTLGMEYMDNIYATPKDSLCLPRINSFGQVDSWRFSPYSWRYSMPWDLHEGLNMNLGLSMFAQFGKHSYSGVGFTQDISAMYVKPITNRLTIAAGGYFSNINWAHDSYRDAGLSAVIGYRFDEHWEAFVYGQKSLVNNHRMPYALYNMQELGDHIGASVRYNVNPSMSIELSVERRNTGVGLASPTPPLQKIGE